jgi:hypothetical protein
MKTDPGHIGQNAQTGGATPAIKVEIYWATSWVDETAYLVAANGEHRIAPPGQVLVASGSEAGSALSLVMDNRTGRYSRLRSGSMANTYGIYGKKVRVQLGYYYGVNPELVTVFTGVIVDIHESETSYQVSLACQDMAAMYEQVKVRTQMYRNIATDEWIGTLCSALGIASYNLERGLTVMPWAWLDDDFGLAAIRAAAAAEGGIAFFDSDGALRFWNAAHWCNATSVLTMTPSLYAELTPRTDYVNVVNVVGAEYQPRQAGAPAIVYSLEKPIFVPPGGSTATTLKFSLPAVQFLGCMLKATIGGHDRSSSISINPSSPQYAMSWDITFSNSDANAGAWVVLFDVLAVPLLGRPAEQIIVDRSSGGTVRRRDFRGNIDMQSLAQAMLLAALTVERFKNPVLYCQISGMYGNPLLELGDVVTVQAINTGINANMVVLAINWRYEAGSYTMDLQLQQFDNFYAYANYFVVGQTQLGSGRLFV